MKLLLKGVIIVLALVGLLWLFSWWLFKVLENMDVDQ